MNSSAESESERAGAAVSKNDREYRLLDQMATMHAELRDRARRVALTLTISTLCGSVVATAFAFAGGDDQISIAGIEAKRSTILGWFAVVVFVITLVDLVLDRRSTARGHSDAVRALTDLGAEYRSRSEESGELSRRYRETVQHVPPIPERDFNRLKARHLRKVEVSKTLSRYPGLSERQARSLVRDSAARKAREMKGGSS